MKYTDSGALMIAARRVSAYEQEVSLRDRSFFCSSGLLFTGGSGNTQSLLLQRKPETTEIQYLRDICSWRLTNVDAPLRPGGNGVVQIDESLFRHKPKVNFL